jgi:non-ribosomal peptide synthetase component E (peptide arylation enzyme)
MEAQGIGFWLTRRAHWNGDREAVVDGNRRISYRELNGRVDRLSRALQTLGLKSGDRCAMELEAFPGRAGLQPVRQRYRNPDL